MARRELEEISAGSMADIAFLLLIFFIVTTTMELEAGIPQQLPIKVELPPDYEFPPVHARDVFSINVNSTNQLLVEDERLLIDDLEAKLYYYYTANLYSQEADPSQAEYILRELDDVKLALIVAEQALTADENNIILKSDVSKLNKRLKVCMAMPDGKFREIKETATIQLKKKAATSYGTYITIINQIGKTVNRVRDEKCKEIYSGISYYDLDPEEAEDLKKMRILELLIPKKVLEPKITN